MPVEENKALLNRLYDLMNRRQLEEYYDLYAPDFVLHGGGSHAFPGQKGGKKSVTGGVGTCTPFPHGDLTRPGLQRTDIRQDGEAQRMRHFFLGKVQQITDPQGRTDGGFGDIIPPPGFKFRRIHQLIDNLIGKGHGTGQAFSVGMHRLAYGQKGA